MLEFARSGGGELAILRLGVDRFKQINDVFGQAIGDAALCEVARRLQPAAQQAFVARVGGDEFSLVSEGPQPATAEALAERLRAALEPEFAINGRGTSISASVGVSVFPGDGDDATTLVANADAALHRAKADGRGRVRFFDAEMDQRLRDRRALRQDLRAAIARGELALHYQPQARIDRTIIGFEALVRWWHPTHGSVSPSIFIPLAEESGLIWSISAWILREACRDAAQWPKPLQLAVNLSPIQFHQDDLVELVRSTLTETGLDPNRLELEITEGILIDDYERAVAVLTALKSFGVRIVLDDFGTGYSSLAYLQSFPFDKIKIDRSFIANLSVNPQSSYITRAIVTLGHGLGLPILGEGVETEEQLAFLRRKSCDQVQGFLIGEPHPIAHYRAITGADSAAPAGSEHGPSAKRHPPQTDDRIVRAEPRNAATADRRNRPRHGTKNAPQSSGEAIRPRVLIFTSPRLRGEVDFRAQRRKSGEGAFHKLSTCGEAPSPASRRPLPASGRGEHVPYTTALAMGLRPPRASPRAPCWRAARLRRALRISPTSPAGARAGCLQPAQTRNRCPPSRSHGRPAWQN